MWWGRKALLTIGSILLGCGWGAYCIDKGVSLTEAGIYWGSVNMPLGMYLGANVYQKTRLNGPTNAPS